MGCNSGICIIRSGILACLCTLSTYGQVPQPAPFPNYGNTHPAIPNSHIPKTSNLMDMIWDTGEQERIRRQNEQLIKEGEEIRKQQQQLRKQGYEDLKNKQTSFGLPGKGHIESTRNYRKAFDKLSQMDPEAFSVKNATFLIENAYYEEQQDYEAFHKTIRQTGDFLREKMDELGYDTNSNLAKNMMLFQFFADTLEIKSKNVAHLPLEYDFDDYTGSNDWSKMFVTKLLETGKGQCNSLPRLYLILAEEIGAEAFLSLSPNHSYIKFRDEDENWYNVELTNGMFTADSFILQSGYIKSEALQNGIYMEALSRRQLLAQFLADFAMGYIHKFGYDPFVKKVVDKSLELDPNLINANMVNANYLTYQFEYAVKQVKINPRDTADLQNIRHYPGIPEMLHRVNAQYHKIDRLGFEYMPAAAYEKWLNSLQEAKQKQDDEAMKRQFNLKHNQPLKD